MALVFHGDPSVIDEPLVAVRLQGRDEAADCYVECRVAYKTLMDCYGAMGSAPRKMLPAFEDHREQIEIAAIRKYEAGRVERLPSGVVAVWLEVADL